MLTKQSNANCKQVESNSPNFSDEQRQANFLSLANLQNKVPKALFQEMLAHIDLERDLPHRTAWDGQSLSCSFEELRLISGHQNSEALSFLLKNQDQITDKIQNFEAAKNKTKIQKNPVSDIVKRSHLVNFDRNCARLFNICNFKKRDQLDKLFQNQSIKSKLNAVKENILNHDLNQYHRMKTVFGHAIITDGAAAPVYNCQFDQSGKFIITGADDGIIKIWRKDTMVLQASLHGHMDFINDIAVSKCNRFMASGSRDGVLILWDLQNCSIIKKIQHDHTSQINRLRFVMMQSGIKQAQKNLPAGSRHSETQNAQIQSNVSHLGVPHPKQHNPITYDQFLVSCSDDGSVNIYDVSSFWRASIDEFYVLEDGQYIPRHRNKPAISNDQDLLLKGLKEVAAIAEDDLDKIARRTRKRNVMGGGITNQTTANSSSQSANNSQDSQIFMVKLRPEDFRAGTRNKHIDSLAISPKGFIAGGTNHGEIYLWKVNFNTIRQRKSDGHYSWINCFKVHKKVIHYIEFDKNGERLLSGSDDGTACIWDTSFIDKSPKPEVPKLAETFAGAHDDSQIRESGENLLAAKDIDISDATLIYRFAEENTKHKLESQIDKIAWSANGRYAIAAMGVKKLEEDDGTKKKDKQQTNSAKVKIKVYDTYSGNVIHNLDKACCLGKQMLNYVLVLKTHPFNDDIMMCCFDGGVNILYDIRQQKIIQEIVEYGIYSIEYYTMNNQMDADFSSDGDYIAFSSNYGTISLYSTQAHVKSRYSCTRVQQFFSYDNQMHDSNLYEALPTQPQLCGYELNPYEVQPSAPIIGRYANLQELRQTPQEFERNLIFAREFAAEEERFYQDQLRDGMREGYFDTSVNLNPINQEGQRLISDFTSPVRINPAQFMDADMHEGSDEELIGGTRQMQARRAARLGNARRRLMRTDEQPEEVEISDDEDFEEDKSMEDEESHSEDDSFASLESEARIHPARMPSYMQPENQPRRANQHELNAVEVNNRLQNIQDDQELRARGNARRSLRRNAPVSQSPTQEQNTAATARNGGRRRMRQVIHSGETSQFGDRNDDDSNFGEARPRGRGLRPGLRQRRVQQIEISSNDPSARSFESEDESVMPRGRRSRTRVGQREPAARTSRNRILRRHNLRDRGSDESDAGMVSERSDESFASGTAEIISDMPKRDKDDEKLEIMITECRMIAKNPDLERDDSFSQRGSKSKKNAVIIKEGKFATMKEGTKEETYVLEVGKPIPEHACCFFCKRVMDNFTMIGPFSKQGKDMIDSSADSFDLWFHKDCLEKNAYVKYNPSNGGKWLNINTAIKHLVTDRDFTCYRCLGKGSTVQCQTCDRSFHGHFCSNLYLLSMGEERPNEFRCIFCVNNDNFYGDKKQLATFQNEMLCDIRKLISREQLLYTQKYSEEQFYMPQINDEVYYFFQGHERFHQSMNCFFYAGNNEVMGSTDLAWMHLAYVKNSPTGSIHCRIVDICHKFPTSRAEKLIQEFGNCSFEGVNQTSAIITYVELEILEDVVPKRQMRNFVVPLFPCEAANYLVPVFQYDHKLLQFFKQKETMVGRRFKTNLGSRLFDGHEVQILAVTPLEPDQFSMSNWNTIVVTEVPMLAARPARGRQQLQEKLEESVRINFWDLIYHDDEKAEVESAFDKYEQARLVDCLTLFFNKNHQLVLEFLERVDPSIAPDYLCYVPADMWLQLIFERIKNSYYRSQDQLWFELDLIAYCSNIYNGPEDELTLKAKNMVEKVRKELKMHINSNKERVLKPRNKVLPVVADLGLSNGGSKPPSRVKFGQVTLGEGGVNFKQALEENLGKDSEPKERVTFDEKDGIITLDPSVPLQYPEERTSKKRGRPAKRQRVNSGEEEPSFNLNGMKSSSETPNDNMLPPRANGRKRPMLGKRSRQQMEGEDSDFAEVDGSSSSSDEPSSNQENIRSNNQPSLRIVIDCDQNNQQESFYASGRPRRQRLIPDH